MEQAKVVMNLKEGIIELEGPLEFVQKYLDMYQPAIRRLALAESGSGRFVGRSLAAPEDGWPAEGGQRSQSPFLRAAYSR